MTAPVAVEEEKQRNLAVKIARVFDDIRSSQAMHARKLKELSALRSASPAANFFAAFSKALMPLFDFQRRNSSAERMIRFVAVFAATRDMKNVSLSDAFLEQFLRFLLVAAAAANKTARVRACQIISEIIMRLPDDAEVSSDVWDEVIDSMKIRVGDKFPAVRMYAIRALSRFVNDSENSDILDLFLQTLPLEQNADVRKAVVLSLPPTSATLTIIVDRTIDSSESVRRASYCVLANKFPLQSLSIKLRTIILQRGLGDRSPGVAKECLKMMKDEWLEKCCNGDPVELLKFLDVETYESVGVSVMNALLQAGAVQLHAGQSLRQFVISPEDANKGESDRCIQLMEAEVAFFWKSFCKHLHMEAQAKGSDAATTTGTESAVYAAEASDSNDLLDLVLPATVSEYVGLVKAHIAAGANYHFASRQLLLLGTMLNFSDALNRKVASEFLLELLNRPLDHEVDEHGNKVVIGDGINIGGDKDWAAAMSELAKRIHAALGEFEAVLLGIIEKLSQPCRERTADCMQWLHCLALTGLLLENTKSFRMMQGKAMEPVDVLNSLLLPGAKHSNMDVQRAAIRCLGLFGLLESRPSEDLVKQLRTSFGKGSCSVAVMACKALVDLAIWHGPHEVDRAINVVQSSQPRDQNISSTQPMIAEDFDVQLLDFLFAGFDMHEPDDDGRDGNEIESVVNVLGEGFSKILLLSEKYPSVDSSFQTRILAKLINLYFSTESIDLPRLKQCLSVFFEHYPSLSLNHKKCISKAFLPAIRSLWPGIDGNPVGSNIMVSNMRRRAVQASRFMLQMIQAPLYAKEGSLVNENSCKFQDSGGPSLEFETGQEGLAIRIAIEVTSFQGKKTAAEKSYTTALCRVLVLLSFRISEQEAAKLMQQLLSRVAESVAAEKDLLKDLKRMAEKLRSLVQHPDQKLSADVADLILGRLELEINAEKLESTEFPETPLPRSSRPSRSRRKVRDAKEFSSDEELSPTSVVATNPGGIAGTRSQRASKTAAMSKLNRTSAVRVINEEDDEDEEAESSGVTSEDDSDV